MNTRIAKLALATIALVAFVSGCASVSHPLAGRKALPVKPDSNSLEIQFGMARLLERNGKLEDARNAYLNILANGPHTPSLHRLGVTAVRQNRLDAGLQHMSKAIAAGAPTAELLGDYGYAQLLAGELEEAETTLKKAVTLDPSQKRNVNNLAIVVGKQNRLNESFQLFRQANPEAEAIANLAFIQAQSEDLSRARLNYNRALDLDPQLKIAAIGLMEVHKHIQTGEADLNQSIETGTQSALPQQRIAQAPRTKAKRVQLANRITGSSHYESHDRVLAKMKRPIQLPDRDPAKPKPQTVNQSMASTNGRRGIFQPRPLSPPNAIQTVAQVSYQEPIQEDSVSEMPVNSQEIINHPPPGS